MHSFCSIHSLTPAHAHVARTCLWSCIKVQVQKAALWSSYQLMGGQRARCGRRFEGGALGDGMGKLFDYYRGVTLKHTACQKAFCLQALYQSQKK